jgi:hypothetical protein
MTTMKLLQNAFFVNNGRAVQVDSIKPSFLELNAPHLINLDRANNVSSHGRAVQVDSIKTRVESAYGFLLCFAESPPRVGAKF